MKNIDASHEDKKNNEEAWNEITCRFPEHFFYPRPHTEEFYQIGSGREVCS